MTNKSKFNNIAIIGLGLIGSSLALAIKKHKIAGSTTGYARSTKTRQIAKKIKLNSHDFRICVELPIKVHNAKINYTDMESYERPRIGGVKKVNALKDGLLILLCMFKLFFIKSK